MGKQISKKKLKILANVLQVPYTEVLRCAGFNIENEVEEALYCFIQDNKLIIIADNNLFPKVMKFGYEIENDEIKVEASS